MSNKLSINDQLTAHVEACAQCELYARQAIELLNAGKRKEGLAASEKAHEWEAKMLALEPKPKTPC